MPSDLLSDRITKFLQRFTLTAEIAPFRETGLFVSVQGKVPSGKKGYILDRLTTMVVMSGKSVSIHFIE